MLKSSKRFPLLFLIIPLLSLDLVTLSVWPAWAKMEAAPSTVDAHIQGIASFAKPSPMIVIPDGWFLMGTNREDGDRHTFEKNYDNTEFPQRRIWLDAFQIDQYEVSLGELAIGCMAISAMAWSSSTANTFPEGLPGYCRNSHTS